MLPSIADRSEVQTFEELLSVEQVDLANFPEFNNQKSATSSVKRLFRSLRPAYKAELAAGAFGMFFPKLLSFGFV